MGDASVANPPSYSDSTTATASTTSGGKTLTLTSGIFTAQEIGEQVSGTGIPAGTKISAITSTTAATLSKAATAAETGESVTITAARSVGDAVTTSGSKTLTSATAKFTAADAGDEVAAAGLPAGTKISKFVSATSVTLSNAATTTATGVTAWFGYGNDYINANLPPAGDQGFCRITTTDGDGIS